MTDQEKIIKYEAVLKNVIAMGQAFIQLIDGKDIPLDSDLNFAGIAITYMIWDADAALKEDPEETIQHKAFQNLFDNLTEQPHE